MKSTDMDPILIQRRWSQDEEIYRGSRGSNFRVLEKRAELGDAREKKEAQPEKIHPRAPRKPLEQEGSLESLLSSSSSLGPPKKSFPATLGAAKSLIQLHSNDLEHLSVLARLDDDLND
ncbi:hypothetical protein E3N88_38469 [Mikania micrantha]|uniref:Uncharacterized protein n=1 Tax=Mikania micrantha TaxID=192012 RepID=A0A5N6LWM4_9ASTR|nr:hypothetical protein E3N88_38469 [Mikania micrantha]